MMKKVLFICLLTLSTCLSKPDNAQELAAQTPAGNTTTPNGKELTPVVNATVPSSPANATKPAAEKSSQTVIDNTNSTAHETKSQVAPKENTDKTNATTNKTTDKEVPKKEESKVDPPKNETVIPHTNPDKKENATIPTNLPDDKNGKKNDTSTTTPVPSPKPSEAPKATDIPPVHSRGFDGPSFIGGIILTLGLLAIGFMGFKYYKNQTERNYHTL